MHRQATDTDSGIIPATVAVGTYMKSKVPINSHMQGPRPSPYSLWLVVQSQKSQGSWLVDSVGLPVVPRTSCSMKRGSEKRGDLEQ